MDASQSKCRIFLTLLSSWSFILLILGSEITESDHQGDNPFGVKQGQGQILKFMSHTSGGRSTRRPGPPVRPVVPIFHYRQESFEVHPSAIWVHHHLLSLFIS